MISIRSGKGIGDNLYLQSIARHLADGGEKMQVCTDWPDIFRPIAGRIELAPYRRISINRVSHYTTRKMIDGTDQFQDCCINAGIKDPVDLRIDWRQINTSLVDRLKYDGRPIVVVQLPREPFGRSDGYGIELLPDCSKIQRAIDEIGGRALVVQVGSGKALFEFKGVDLDLTGKTTVCDLLDVASVATGFLGYCSFLIPLAESFSKPAMLVWSRRGLASRDEYIRTITPKKILHRATSRAVFDDCPDIEIAEAVDALLESSGSRYALCG